LIKNTPVRQLAEGYFLFGEFLVKIKSPTTRDNADDGGFGKRGWVLVLLLL